MTGLNDALDTLLATGGDAPNRTRSRPQHPQGWEPGVEWDGTRGRITSRPLEAPTPNWDDLLKSWDFDPKLFRILEPVQIRTWEAAIGKGKTKQLWYYRAQIVSRVPGDAVDVNQLIREIKRRQPRDQRPTGDGAFVVVLSDWQMGKKDGDGARGTINRVTESIEQVKARIAELRQAGRSLGSLYILTLGDMIEGCDGHYDMQAFNVELDRRDQVKVTRRLIVRAVTELAPHFERVVVSGVAGNHGENRKDGKAFTTFGDNDDVAILEQVAEVIKAGPAFEHVSFAIPTDRLTMTLDVAGTILGLSHGHQARAGGHPAVKIEKWMAGQALGRQLVGDADILLTGHYHSLIIQRIGDRWHIQAPALDGGSRWHEETKGDPTLPGTLTFAVYPDQKGHWRDLAVV